VYIQLEAEGTRVSRGDPIGSVEAAKMVSPLYAPISGTIARRNEAVLRNPALVNADPYGRGWLVELEPSHWEAEAAELIHGADRVARWLEEEVARYREQGWIE
jgi:glycine cleavage system H protein